MNRVCSMGMVVISLLSVSMTGCSGGGGKLTGSVNLNGKPLADARVEFHPKDNLNLSAADVRTDQQGHFEILPRPKGGKSLPPGQYVVLVRKLVDKQGNVPDDENYGQLEAAGQLINQVPPRYGDRDFPQINVEINSDTKEIPPFELKGG
ncbi:MAG TPA: hypothetical protein VH643_20540 [Gemmataceae bacterium]